METFSLYIYMLFHKVYKSLEISPSKTPSISFSLGFWIIVLLPKASISPYIQELCWFNKRLFFSSFSNKIYIIIYCINVFCLYHHVFLCVFSILPQNCFPLSFKVYVVFHVMDTKVTSNFVCHNCYFFQEQKSLLFWDLIFWLCHKKNNSLKVDSPRPISHLGTPQRTVKISFVWKENETNWKNKMYNLND